MTNADLAQQIIRILLYIGSPLLVKWGIDAESTTAILTGAGTLIAAVAWWFFWNRNKT